MLLFMNHKTWGLSFCSQSHFTFFSEQPSNIIFVSINFIYISWNSLTLPYLWQLESWFQNFICSSLYGVWLRFYSCKCPFLLFKHVLILIECRFHPSCMNMTIEQAKKLDNFVCADCAPDNDPKRANSYHGSTGPKVRD